MLVMSSQLGVMSWVGANGTTVRVGLPGIGFALTRLASAEVAEGLLDLLISITGGRGLRGVKITRVLHLSKGVHE